MNGKIEKVLWHESDDVSKIEFSIFAMEAFLKKTRSRRFICVYDFRISGNRGIGELPGKRHFVGQNALLAKLPHLHFGTLFPTKKVKKHS